MKNQYVNRLSKNVYLYLGWLLSSWPIHFIFGKDRKSFWPLFFPRLILFGKMEEQCDFEPIKNSRKSSLWAPEGECVNRLSVVKMAFPKADPRIITGTAGGKWWIIKSRKPSNLYKFHRAWWEWKVFTSLLAGLYSNFFFISMFRKGICIPNYLWRLEHKHYYVNNAI